MLQTTYLQRTSGELFYGKFDFSNVLLTAGMDETAFQADVRTQFTVLYELTVLGEAVKRLLQEF